MSTYSDKSRAPLKHKAREFVNSHLASRCFYAIFIVGWEKDTGLFQCDDIPYFETQGFDRSRMIVCGIGDKYGAAAAWARREYPGVIASPHDKIESTTWWALQNNMPLSLVNVDLCAAVQGASPIIRDVLLQIRESPIRLHSSLTVALTHARFRDGYGSEWERDAHIHRILAMEGIAPSPRSFDGCTDKENGNILCCGRQFKYQSYTLDALKEKDSPGSPMCVKIYKPRYICKKCGLADEHPGAHKKNCGNSWTDYG